MKHKTKWLCRMLATPGMVASVLGIGAGCQRHANPAFRLTNDEAVEAIETMAESPKTLARPLLVLDGFGSPGIGSHVLWSHLSEGFTVESRPMLLSFFGAKDLAACRDKVLDAAEVRWPGITATGLPEVDVVGYSMGGVIARYAAMDTGDGRRLPVHTVYTFSTPHQGSDWAKPPTFYALVKDMRPDSDVIQTLADDAFTYELVPYARLGDDLVKPTQASPPGMQVIWVDTPPMGNAHLGAVTDDRLIADAMRRLRGEKPFGQPGPLPEAE